MAPSIRRCPWVKMSNELYVRYHDEEWGKPVHDDSHHFELLVLEGAQAGLSWETILNKRENYRKAYNGFDPLKVSRFTKAKVETLLANPGIIRNRLKIESSISNAKAYLKVQDEFGSFDDYVWGFVDGSPVVNKLRKLSDYPVSTKESDALAKDLKKRGFRFVGTTTMYAYMQSAGLVNDHTVDCSFRGV